ncbi:MAG: hypothetical protein NZM09_05010 [Ignavibacterium sp.]|nr:hypothetical protein [Ignavibacterium sp.]MCX7610027.1 hypothetical protein [Ignavibacterium sp.]MDW8375035.1 hypothetical protein [Ignavibacteriales bacterium]
MSKRNIVLIVFTFLISFLLIEITYPELFSNKIVSYLVLGFGFSLWIYSYHTQNTAGIFSGVFIFFSGIMLFVISSFVIWNPSRMIFPGLIISLGLASFFSYLNDRKFYFIIFGVIFLILGFNFLYARMSFKFYVFLNAIPDLILGVGVLVVIIFLIYGFLMKKKLEENSYINNQSIMTEEQNNELK